MKKLLVLLLISTAFGCVTVRPQQRGILSDPIMRFEGAFGAEGVSGGGCGCN